MKEGKELENLFRKFKQNDCSKEDIEVLQQYLKRDDLALNFDQIMRKYDLTLDLMGRLEEILNLPIEEESKISFQLVKKVIERSEPQLSTAKKSAGSAWYFKAAAIAILAALFGSGLYYMNGIKNEQPVLLEKVAKLGEKSMLTLGDGSTVFLNSGSKLSYPQEFGDNREVTLEGEGFFMIKRNEEKPFIVKSRNLETKVLGTSFNIKAYPAEENIVIAVASGKVAVSKKTDNKVAEPYLLGPNDLITYNSSDDQVKIESKDDIVDLIAWREGVLKFTLTSFEEVAKSLERWYGTKIILNNRQLGNCMITMEFKNESLENVLKALQFMIDVEYQFLKDKVVVRGKGC